MKLGRSPVNGNLFVLLGRLAVLQGIVLMMLMAGVIMSAVTGSMGHWVPIVIGILVALAVVKAIH